jgi:cell division transport system permease protein
VRGASVDDHAVWASRLRTMARTMVVAGFAVVVLMLTAMVLSVVFATRAAMAGNRDVIEVLHFVGAEDRFIAAQFQRHFLKLGLVGGAIGGVAAIVVFLVAYFATRSRGDALADQAQALFGGFSVGWSGHLGALAVVAAVAVATAVTSRLTVLGHLGRLD